MNSTSSQLKISTLGAKPLTLFLYKYEEGKASEWGNAAIAALRKRFREADQKQVISVPSSDKFNFIDMLGTVARVGDDLRGRQRGRN
jgi:hypothetical protein